MFFRLICRLYGHRWSPGPTGRPDGWWALTGKDYGWGGYTKRRHCERCGHTEYGGTAA
jgi:hypothetical protein